MLLSFAALDGVVDDGLFSSSMVNLLGKDDDESLINFSSYLVLRALYAESIGTLIGGFRLSGLQFMRAIIQQVSAKESCSKSVLTDQVPVAILNAKVLPQNVVFLDLLNNAKFTMDYSDIKDIVLGNISFYGLSSSSVPMNYQQKHDVVQLLVDKSGSRTYALCRDGQCSVFDNVTGNVILSQRLLYAEPLLSRSVEGLDKHLKWLVDSGLTSPDDPGVPSSKDRYNDMVFISKVLSDFAFTIGITNVLVLDVESGFVIVNNSLTSSSICIHEPVSLRRIYRVKAPGALSSDLEKAVRDISSSRMHSSRSHIAPIGCVRDIKVSSAKSLLVCSVFGSKSVYITNLLTGDIISELTGHMGTLNTISKINFLYLFIEYIFKSSCNYILYNVNYIQVTMKEMV